MFFRGTSFQRDGHGGCNLLPASALPSKNAHLFPCVLKAHLKALRPRSFFFSITPALELEHPLECDAYDPLMVPAVSSTIALRSDARADENHPHGVCPCASRRTRASRTSERVTYVRCLLGHRIWSFDYGRNPLHLRRHPIFQTERITQGFDRES